MNFFSNTQKKKTFKSNNKNNNYINQLLRLALSKQTHTQITAIIKIIKKKDNTNPPPQEISSPTSLQ